MLPGHRRKRTGRSLVLRAMGLRATESRGALGAVQRLALSRGTLTHVSEPALHDGVVEIAWGRTRSGEDMHVASAPLGGSLGRAHYAETLLPGRRAEETYAEVSAAGSTRSVNTARKRTNTSPATSSNGCVSNGHLGRAHILEGRLLTEPAHIGGRGGAEDYLFEGESGQRLFVAFPEPHARHVGLPRVLLRNVVGSPENTRRQRRTARAAGRRSRAGRARRHRRGDDLSVRRPGPGAWWNVSRDPRRAIHGRDRRPRRLADRHHVLERRSDLAAPVRRGLPLRAAAHTAGPCAHELHRTACAHSGEPAPSTWPSRRLGKHSR